MVHLHYPAGCEWGILARLRHSVADVRLVSNSGFQHQTTSGHYFYDLRAGASYLSLTIVEDSTGNEGLND